MKPFAAYIKTQLNVNYGISALKYRFTREKKKLWEPVLIAIAIVVSIVPLLFLYTLMMSGVFTAGLMLDQPEIVLTTAFMFTQLVILLFGMFYIMGMFYFSKDLEALVPLPLKPYEVVGGKFVVVMINEYITALPVLLPPLIIYGTGTGQGLLYWIKSVLLILAAPVIPLAIASLIIMILMRFINFRRYKDFFAIIGGLAAIALGMGVSMFSQNFKNIEDPDYINNLVLKQSGLIDMIGKRFPPSIWASKGLSMNGIQGMGYLALFIIVCILLFLLLLWLSDKVFYKSLLAGQEVTRRKKILSAGQLTKKYDKASSPIQAIMVREWKVLFRTPVYALNGLTSAIIGPIMVLIMFVFQGAGEDTKQLIEMIYRPEIAPYILLGSIGLMLFTAGMNLVASTSLSREGNTFWISKLIPVPAKQQVTAKLLLSCIVSASGIIITGIIMLALFKLSPVWVAGALIVGLLGSVPMAAISLLIDIFHPKLVWNSEQEAIKQNMNGVLGMLLSLLIMLVLGAAAVIMMMLELSMWLVLTVLSLLSAIMGGLTLLALYTVAARKYGELEA